MNTNEAKAILEQMAAHHAALSVEQREAINTALSMYERTKKRWLDTASDCKELVREINKLRRQLNWIYQTTNDAGAISILGGRKGQPISVTYCCYVDGYDTYGAGKNLNAALEDARKKHPVKRKGGK